MAIRSNDIKRVIITSVYKVLRQSAPYKWTDIRERAIQDFFSTISNPTGWDSFYAEAVATTLHQEIILRGSCVPGLEETFVEFAGEGAEETWTDLEHHIRENARDISQPWLEA